MLLEKMFLKVSKKRKSLKELKKITIMKRNEKLLNFIPFQIITIIRMVGQNHPVHTEKYL